MRLYSFFVSPLTQNVAYNCFAVNIDLGDSIHGGISGDGQISAYDAALALASPSGDAALRAEVSGGAPVDALDAAYIAQKAAGLIELFPVQG